MDYFSIYELEPGRISTFIIDALGGPMPYTMYTQGDPEREEDDIGQFIMPQKGDFAYELLYFTWMIYFGQVDCRYRKRKKRFELISKYGLELPDAAVLLGPTAFPDLYTLAMQMRLADAADYLFDDPNEGEKIWIKYPFKLDRTTKAKYYYYHNEEVNYSYYRSSKKHSVCVPKITCVGPYNLSYHKAPELNLRDKRVADGYKRRKSLRIEELQEVPIIAKLLKGYVEN
ncbi:hypothetical protein [Litoribacter populi]|uniref:hypothetical protein n=1 Tax=Litoribacter populi TaxID=2598460 RepID=UPI00117FDFDF|nr:hypothetical protein [Litoribacter populi]